MDELRQQDLNLVAEQLGREPTTRFSVVVRCAPDGHPLVIRNAAQDAEGHPFPTTYWLTCPEAVAAVSRVESTGAVARFNERMQTDPAFATAVEDAHAAYAAARAVHGPPGSEDWGGVAGTRTGVKCLHAHYANHLVGGDDPIGAWTASQIEPIHRPACADRVAVIDQGTNSTRLLIAEPIADQAFLELSRDMVITRLGHGVGATGSFDPQAVERTLDTIRSFSRRARALHALRIQASATSAVRDAADRDAFATSVREATGSDLRVIDGTHEAALSFLGATRALEGRLGAPPWLVLDIGGGSTEFIVGQGQAVSVQMGSVRLTERFVRNDPPLPGELAKMEVEIDARIEEALQTVDELRSAGSMVAVAGTATTVMAITLGLSRYDPDAIHGSILRLEDVREVSGRLASMTTAERAALSVMAPGRADVIVAGTLILVRTMERLGFLEATVSEEDILDGLAVELLWGG